MIKHAEDLAKLGWQYFECPACGSEGARAFPKPEQEPVVWMYPDDYERMTTSETFCTVYSVEVGSATRGETTVALYTSPPTLSLAQRQARSADTWVGLTDEEKRQLFDREDYQGWLDYINAIEAKLRSKNEDRN